MTSDKTHSPDAFERANSLVSELPSSWPLIDEILRHPIDGSIAELQFSLLVRLEELFEDVSLDSLWHECLESVAAMLSNADSEAGMAAWKAADLLADHVPLSLSLPYLLRCSTDGSASLSRILAIDAIRMAWNKSEVQDKVMIVNSLKWSIEHDKEALVAEHAFQVLSDLAKYRGCP